MIITSNNQNTYQGLLRIHNQNLGKSAWWALATRVSETRQEQIVEFHETMLNNMKEDLTNLRSYRGETELIKSLDANIKNMEATTDKLASMYAQAEELEDGSLSNGDEIYAVMRDELRPEVLKTVENTRQMTSNVTNEVTRSYDLTIVIMTIMVVISIIMTILLIIFMKNAQNTLTKCVVMPVDEVAKAAEQMARGDLNVAIDYHANELAEGATDQAAAVEELTASVSTVTEQTEKMAADCAKGVQMSIAAQKVAKDGADKMDQVTEAMQRITTASKEIQEVANSIEAISSQTKLLALNASIEAARAGDTGKGFAVVAQEIGQLAQHQASNMREINQGIEQISEVIQNNSATAQESSAVSSELSDQSNQLHNLMSQFQVKLV